MARAVVSARGKLISQDLKKVLVGAGLAAAGAILTYLVEALPNIDLGQWQPIIAAVLAVLVNLVRKLVNENKY